MKTIQLRQPINRRKFTRLAAGWLGLGLFPGPLRAQEGYPRLPDNIDQLDRPESLVYAIWRYVGSVYYFDPIGLYVEPGETVGFVVGGTSGRTPTITAYHPGHDNHELRIPEGANPFDSGNIQRNRREPAFRWTFEVEGTYDYFSKYQEWSGMIGRIVVGRPDGPGEKPWGYGNREGRRPIPPEVLKRTELLDSERIVRERSVSFPFERFYLPYPLW